MPYACRLKEPEQQAENRSADGSSKQPSLTVIGNKCLYRCRIEPVTLLYDERGICGKRQANNISTNEQQAAKQQP